MNKHINSWNPAAKKHIVIYDTQVKNHYCHLSAFLWMRMSGDFKYLSTYSMPLFKYRLIGTPVVKSTAYYCVWLLSITITHAQGGHFIPCGCLCVSNWWVRNFSPANSGGWMAKCLLAKVEFVLPTGMVVSLPSGHSKSSFWVLLAFLTASDACLISAQTCLRHISPFLPSSVRSKTLSACWRIPKCQAADQSR